VVDHVEERRQALARYRPGRQLRAGAARTIVAALAG
jgi:hypothetical protein